MSKITVLQFSEYISSRLDLIEKKKRPGLYVSPYMTIRIHHHDMLVNRIKTKFKVQFINRVISILNRLLLIPCIFRQQTTLPSFSTNFLTAMFPAVRKIPELLNLGIGIFLE